MTQFASTLYPQMNPTNPILLALREREGRDRMYFVRGFLNHRPEGYRWPNWTAEHVRHARRVFERLAALTG